MNKTLILTYHRDAYFYPFVKSRNIYIEEPIKKRTFLYKIFFRLPVFSIFSYGFLDKISKVNKIIIFDSAYNWLLGIFLVKFLRKKNVYLYYWNPISKMYPRSGKKMVLNAKKMLRVFSFDHADCLKFKLEYAPIVYSKDVLVELEKDNCQKLEYDLFFLGLQKDRYEHLMYIYNKYFKGKLKCKIIIIGKEDSAVDSDFNFSRKRYSYEQYLQFVKKSKAILDIPQEGQDGLTLRNVESIFLKKKLITTKLNIEKYDFYNPRNIFIIGKDDPQNLKSFIESEYIELDENIKKKYELETWIEKLE